MHHHEEIKLAQRGTDEHMAVRLQQDLKSFVLFASANMSEEIGDVLKPLLLKDLRTNCRARNLNPGGSRESLFERLKENMLETHNL